MRSITPEKMFLGVLGFMLISLGGIIILTQTSAIELLLGYGLGGSGTILLFIGEVFLKPDNIPQIKDRTSKLPINQHAQRLAK